METHEIRYFLAMVRELNFTRAAAACGITQPALTRAIKKLENELGGALFLRHPGRIELTRLAREILPELETILRTLSSVQARAATVVDAQTSTLRLGVMCTVGPTHVVSLLARLREAIDDVDVSILDAKASEIMDLIVRDEVDVGLAAWPHVPENVRAEPVLVERYAVAMKEGAPLSAGETVQLDQLAGQRYIDRLGCEFDDYYEALHGKWTIDLDVCFASEREDWIQEILLAGLGYAVVPELMVMRPGIVKLPLSAPEVRREVSILTLRGKLLPPAAVTFTRLAKAHKWRPD